MSIYNPLRKRKEEEENKPKRSDFTDEELIFLSTLVRSAMSKSRQRTELDGVRLGSTTYKKLQDLLFSREIPIKKNK